MPLSSWCQLWDDKLNKASGLGVRWIRKIHEANHRHVSFALYQWRLVALVSS